MSEIKTVPPLVSVFVLVYNHEKYISGALDGILMQKVEFEYEIVLGEDCSTDNSREIILRYAQKHPGKFKLILHEKNVGAMKNQMAVLSVCTGKYIAMCEGDDYWTDPLKLQKQADFLEANPEYSGASHQSLVIFDDETDKQPKLFREHDLTDIETQHLLDGRLFHTASLMFRSEIIKKHSLPKDITAGDRALFFLLAACGKIHYSNEVMCMYRKHAGGVSSWVTTEMLEKDLKIVPWISKINPEFPGHRYYQFLHLVALSYPNSLSIFGVIKHSFLYMYHYFFVTPRNFSSLKQFFTHHIPAFLAKVKF